MRYMDAIEKRQSVRNFQSKELSVNQIYLLEDFFKEVPHLVDGIATEMVIMGDTTGVRLEGVAGYEDTASTRLIMFLFCRRKKMDIWKMPDLSRKTWF